MESRSARDVEDGTKLISISGRKEHNEEKKVGTLILFCEVTQATIRTCGERTAIQGSG